MTMSGVKACKTMSQEETGILLVNRPLYFKRPLVPTMAEVPVKLAPVNIPQQNQA